MNDDSKGAGSGQGANRDHWSSVFTEKAEGDVSWFQQHPNTSLGFIRKAASGLDAKIVDVGGGASRLVDALLDAGYQGLAVVDIAGSALERSRQRLGARAEQVSWITSAIGSWIPGEAFDVWHDRAVFHFMTLPEERATYLATMRRGLKLGGHAIIATFALDGPERCSGLPVRRYEPEALAAELGRGFSLLESLREEHLTPGGKTQSFQYSLFRRLA
jgi:SAM-dependent methyltransferase